jgi:hypothetical protein
MIDGFSEAQIIGALIAVLMASYAAFFGWLVTSINGLRRDMHEIDCDTRLNLGGRIDALERKLDTVDTRLSAKLETLDNQLSTKIEAVDAKLSAKIDAVDTKLSAKIDAVTIAVSRLEGAVYHGLPEPRRAVSEQ